MCPQINLLQILFSNSLYRTNMTTNRVISYKTLQTISKAGKQLSLGAATKTELWERPEAGITPISQEGFKKAVEQSAQTLPEGTAKVVWRWVLGFGSENTELILSIERQSTMIKTPTSPLCASTRTTNTLELSILRRKTERVRIWVDQALARQELDFTHIGAISGGLCMSNVCTGRPLTYNMN